MDKHSSTRPSANWISCAGSSGQRRRATGAVLQATHARRSRAERLEERIDTKLQPSRDSLQGGTPFGQVGHVLLLGRWVMPSPLAPVKWIRDWFCWPALISEGTGEVGHLETGVLEHWKMSRFSTVGWRISLPNEWPLHTHDE